MCTLEETIIFHGTIKTFRNHLTYLIIMYLCSLKKLISYGVIYNFRLKFLKWNLSAEKIKTIFTISRLLYFLFIRFYKTCYQQIFIIIFLKIY